MFRYPRDLSRADPSSMAPHRHRTSDRKSSGQRHSRHLPRRASCRVCMIGHVVLHFLHLRRPSVSEKAVKTIGTPPLTSGSNLTAFACRYLLVPVVIPVFDPAIVAPGGPIGTMACSYGVFAHIMYGLVGSGSAASVYPNSLLGGPKIMI
jgi:hypothetical protein